MTARNGARSWAVDDHCCPNYNLVLGSNACVAWVSVWPSCKGCVPLPSGEGGAERRVRVRECVNLGPHPALFLRLHPVGLALRAATFSQREKDTPSGFSLIWTTVRMTWLQIAPTTAPSDIPPA